MRCDQFMGLPKHALEFLREWERKCPHCQQSLPGKQVIGYYMGMFDDAHPLVRYQLKDGRYADEFLQGESLSSGSIFFLGLKVSDRGEYRWTQDEIDNASR